MTANASKTSSPITTKPLQVHARMLALEPRFVFDAAIATELHTLTDVHVDTRDVTLIATETGASIVAAARELAAIDAARDGVKVFARDANVDRLLEVYVTAHNLAPTNHEIAFIDNRLADLSTLISSIPEGTRIVLIDGTRDGVVQMVDALRGVSGITGIHILSHGSEGHLQIGAAVLDVTSMSGMYRSALSSLHGNLASGADILVYGCDFGKGAEGARAAELLSNLTGADVAASTDLTGAADQGGNWVLEEKTGAIEARSFASDQWEHTLAPMLISANTPPIINLGTANEGIFTGVGTVVSWQNAGTVGGVPIDLRATVVDFVGTASPTFHIGNVAAGSTGDNPGIFLWSAGSMTVRWEVYQAGTNILAAGSPEFRIADIDGIGGVPNTREVVTPSLNGLASYTVSSPSNLLVTTGPGGVSASGMQNQNGEPSSLVGFQWNEVSSWTVKYNNYVANAYFSHDGDGEFAFVSPVTTNLLQLDLDGNDSAALGTAYQATYTENGAAVSVVDTDLSIAQHVAIGTTLDQAHITLTNAQPGDTLNVGALPAGITAAVDTSIAGVSTVTLSGNASVADYEAALKAITFGNSTTNPSAVDRLVTIDVTNATYGTTSNSAVATLRVVPVNDVPVVDLNTAPSAGDTNVDRAITFTEDSAPVSVFVATGGALDGDGTDIRDVTISLSNFAKTGTEVINIGGVSLTIDGATGSGNFSATFDADGNTSGGPGTTFNIAYDAAAGTITVTRTAGGAMTPIDLDALLQSITFADISQAPNTALARSISFVAHDLAGAASAPATAAITVVAVNDPPVIDLAIDPVPVNLLANSDFSAGLTGWSGPTAAGITYQHATNAVGVVVDGHTTGTATDPFLIIDTGFPNAFTGVLLQQSVQLEAGKTYSLSAWAGSFYPANPARLEFALSGNVLNTTTLSTSAAWQNMTGTFTPTVSGTYNFTVRDLNPVGGGNDFHLDDIQLTVLKDINVNYATTFTENGAPISVANAANADVNDIGEADLKSLTIVAAGMRDGVNEKVVIGGKTFNLATSDTQLLNLGGGTFATVDYNATTATFSITNASAGVMPQASLDTLVRGMTFEDAGENPTAGARTLTFTATDAGGLTSAPAVSTITVVPVNDAPIVDLNSAYAPTDTNYDAVVTFTEGGAPTSIATIAASVTDFDSATIAGAVIELTNSKPGDVLWIASGLPAGITATTDDTVPGHIKITLAGSATKADYTSVIKAITFKNTSESPDATDRTVTVTVNDGALDSNTAVSTIQVVPVNDPPVIDLNGAGPNLVVNGSFETNALNGANSTLFMLNGDSTSMPGWTVVAPGVDENMQLSHNGQYGVTFATDGQYGLDLTGDHGYPGISQVVNGTVAGQTYEVAFDYGTVFGIPLWNVVSVETFADGVLLGTTTYSSATGSFSSQSYQFVATGPSTEIRFMASFANGGSKLGITFDNVSLRAMPGDLNYANTFTEGGSAVSIADPIKADARDFGEGDLTSLKVTLGNISDGGFETVTIGASTFALNVASTATVTVGSTSFNVAYDPATGFAITNAAGAAVPMNQADLDGLVRGMTYANTSEDPTAGDRTLTFVLTDSGNASSPPAVSTITVIPVNDAPTANPDSVNAGYLTPVVVDLLGNDTDIEGDTLTVTSATVDPAQGTLSEDPTTHVWTFTPATGFSGTAVISYTITDIDGATSSSTHDVVVATAPPVLADPDPTPGTPSINPADPSNLLVPAVDNVAVSVPLATYFSDPNGDPLTITPNLTGAPAWVTYDPVSKTLGGTPPADNAGPVTIPVTVSDGKGGVTVVTITINPANPGPMANADTSSTGYLTPVVVTLLANDTDADGDLLTVTAATVPANQGTLANVAGVWTFTPKAGFSGTAVISYTITDIDGATSSSTHDVVVGAPAKPIAVNDYYTTIYGTAFNGDARTGDSFPAGSTFQPLSLPMNGTLAFQPDGTYTFTPAAGFVGTETFVYQITDPLGRTALAIEVIRVAPPAIVAVNDVVTTPINTALNGNAAANDTFAIGSSFIAITAPAHGTLAFNADGTYVYTPAAGFSGVDMFAYAITDPTGQTRFATDMITVMPPPGPVAVDDSYTTGYRTPVAGNAGANDSYVTGSTFAATSQPLHGTLVFNPDGTYSYTPSAGFAGSDTFNYKITDSFGRTATAQETVTVSAPTLVAVNDHFAGVYGVPVSGNAAAGDTFAAGSTFTVATPAGHGSVAMNPDGTYTYTAAAGFSGTDTFTYRVTDPTGQSVTATETINITPPTLVAVNDHYAGVLGVPVSGNAAAGDTFAAGSTFTVATPAGHGGVVMNTNGTYTYTAAAGFTGTDTFTYRITDPAGQSVTATETIVITPPTLIAVDDRFTTAFRTSVSGNAALGDTVAPGSTFTIATAPAVGTVAMNANGTYLYTPPTNFAGTVTFSYRVTDPSGASATAAETIVVSAPQLIGNNHSLTTPYATALGGNASLGVTYAPGSVFMASSSPAHGSVTMNADGTYQYMPVSGFSGLDAFTYTITDPTGQTVTATETITVEAPPAVHRCLTTFGNLKDRIRR